MGLHQSCAIFRPTSERTKKVGAYKRHGVSLAAHGSCFQGRWVGLSSRVVQCTAIGLAGDKRVTVLRPGTPGAIGPTQARDETLLSMVESDMEFYL